MSSAEAVKPNLLHRAVAISALDNLVDIYDLILFSVVRKKRSQSFGVSEENFLQSGTNLINLQMIGMLVGGIIWGFLGDKRGCISLLYCSIVAALIGEAMSWRFGYALGGVLGLLLLFLRMQTGDSEMCAKASVKGAILRGNFFLFYQQRTFCASHILPWARSSRLVSCLVFRDLASGLLRHYVGSLRRVIFAFMVASPLRQRVHVSYADLLCR